jgi:hypothetical protein
VKGARVRRAITHLAGHYFVRSPIGESKGGAGGKGKLTPNDSIAAHKAAFAIKEVHGTAAPA